MPFHLLKNNKEAFFVYDLNILEENILKLRNFFPKADRFFYSIKSNPNPEIIKKLNSFKTIGFDVSTEEELEHVLHQGVPEQIISFSGPAKTLRAIELIKKKSLYSIHVDSEEEYELLKQSSQKLTLRIPLEESFSQKVGLQISVIEKILNTCAEKRILGFHIYIGRERASKELAAVYIEKMEELFLKYKNSFNATPEIFWGAGLPQIDFAEQNLLPDFKGYKFHIECGRAISSSVGTYYVPILAKKHREKDLLIIDGGLQHLATHFSSPKFGQKMLQVKFYNSNGEIIANDSKALMDIYGSLGVWHDLMIKDLEVPKSLSRGDWLAISPAGSYGPTAATTQFIGSRFPKEYVKIMKEFKVASPENFISYLEAGLFENSKS